MSGSNRKILDPLILRYCGSYVVGVSIAAIIASLLGGSSLPLILYSLAVGAPFFLAALVLGLVFKKSVAQHPFKWAAAVPIVTALIWFPLAKSAGELFNGNRLALYATLCGACCAVAFWISTRLWPLR